MAVKKNRRRHTGFIIKSSLGIAFIIMMWIGYNKFRMVFDPNVLVNSDKQEAYFYIPSGADFKMVTDLLISESILKDKRSFIWTAKMAGYDSNIFPGRFLIRNGISNYKLVKTLRPGHNIPVKIVLNPVDYKDDLSGFIGNNLELDSADLYSHLNDNDYLEEYGFNRENIIGLFIPNTYEFYWNTDVDGFFKRMKREYDKIWDSTRKEQAATLKLDPQEVAILASIVQKETSKRDEWPKIAGVYLNRIRRKMPLSADPTIKFLYRGEVIKRIKKYHLEKVSPYNTYKNPGLPPGPITMPEIAAIDAVLKPEEHNYLYFCARADRSGYHHFSRTFEQHKRYARQYWRSLNKRQIR